MTHDTTLLMTGQDLPTLRAKFARQDDPLRAYWKHLQLLGRRNPFWFSTYNVLAFLVTGHDSNRQAARDQFLRFTHAKDHGLLTKEVQFHTHTASAPLGRLMALYDWIAETDLLTSDENHAFREAALDFAAQVSMQQLQGRARSFDNQVFSNAFGAAVAGHVLGMRRGDSAQGRHIFAVGMEWLLDQFSRLPHGCYSGEGSTYHMLVVMPLLTLAGAFLEEVTGLPIYHRGIKPSYSPLRDWLVMCRDMTGPAGLVPGWDAYGVFRNTVRSPLAYLARRDNDPDALALIRDADMWYPFAHIAWEFDDRLWTLVWWPEKLQASAVAPFHPWMNPSSAGAIQDARTKTRLFQYWDECGGGPWNGRSNVNPNAIDLQSNGLPLLLDGAPSIPFDLLNFNEKAMLDYLPEGVMHGLRAMIGQPDTADGMAKTLRHAVGGSIGDSNSLIIDEENWFVPLHAASGKGVALHDAGALQVIESDAVDYYKDRYDVVRANRISALIDGRVVLCLDDWETKTPHVLTWQAFTWPDAVIDGSVVKANIGNQLQLDLIPGQPGAWKSTSVKGFPKSPCNASTRVGFTLPRSVSSARLLMGMVIQDRLDPGADWSGGWTLEGQGEKRQNVDLTDFYLTDEAPSGSDLQFHRSFKLSTEESARPRFLRIPSATLAIKVHVSGVEIPGSYPQYNMEIQGSTSDFPHLFDITRACRPGENLITLNVHTFHGESIRGPITVHQSVPVASAHIHNPHPHQWAVEVSGQTSHVLLANQGMTIWQNGKTDARHALLCASGQIALAGVTSAHLPSHQISVKSNLPVDLSIAEGSIRLGRLVPNATVVIRIADEVVVIRSMAVLQISSSSKSTLSFRLDEPRTCILNGRKLGRRGGPGDRLVELKAPAHVADHLKIRSGDDVYRLADRMPRDFEDQLLACLRSGDWRIQTAAADIAGLFDVHAAVPVLLALLQEEETKPAHPHLSKSWSESKMNSALEDGVDHSPETSIDPVEGTKRFRLKRALFAALGRLGDSRAVAPLEKVMARGTDFFPSLSQVPLALARLGSPTSIPILESHKNYGEINVRMHVHLALDLLRGRISRTEFESRANPT
jgi:hypothetical protein